MAAKFDILGIGCVAVDDLLYVDTFPAADAKMQIRRSERRCGGLTGTALVAAAKLGARCAFAGLLGPDDLSEVVKSNFEAHGVDTANTVWRSDARPVHSVIIAAETTGTRNIFFDASAPTGADPNEPGEETIRSARVLFLDYLGVEGGIRAARIAREARIPVVADLEGDDDPLFQLLLGLVDHLIVSDEFAQRITGERSAEDCARALWNPTRDSVVVTCGKDGAWYTSGEKATHLPAFAVQAVDTTGCGDVFHGAYAFALARGEELEMRVKYASAAAAIKAKGSELPTASEVAQLLIENPSILQSSNPATRGAR